MKRLSELSQILWLLFVAAGCISHSNSGEETPDTVGATDSVNVAERFLSDITEEAEAFADTLMMGMSLRQKVGQILMPTIKADGSEETMERLRYYTDSLWVGGIVLLKGTQAGAFAMAEKGLQGATPLFIAIDAEWGLGMRLEDAPRFPKNGVISPDADEQLLFEYGEEVAEECRRIGINMVLGPVIDVAENPRGIIGQRSFGGDPKRVADLGVAYARGLEARGIVSVAKHFPGHGSPAEDSHKSKPIIQRSFHQLDSIDLYPFRRYVAAGLSGVMVGHLAVPAIDPESLPAAVSEVVINDLLRRELDFHGLVLTDALNMGGAEGNDAASALKAGADIVIGPADTSKEIENILSEIEKGELSEEIVTDRCRRILFYKILKGLFDMSAGSMNEDNILNEQREAAEKIRLRLSSSNSS